MHTSVIRLQWETSSQTGVWQICRSEFSFVGTQHCQVAVCCCKAPILFLCAVALFMANLSSAGSYLNCSILEDSIADTHFDIGHAGLLKIPFIKAWYIMLHMCMINSLAY